MTNISESDKIELVQSGAYVTIFDLLEEQGITNPYYINFDNLDQLNVIERVRNTFKKIANSKHMLPESCHYLLDKINEPKNLQFLVKRTLKELENKTKMVFDIEDNLLLEENIPDEIYERPKFKISPTEKFGTDFNMMLGTITKLQLVDGVFQKSLNKLGLPQYMKRGEVLNDLFKDVTNLNNLELMVQTLESKKESKPYYQEILDYINSPKDYIDIKGEYYQIDDFENMFYSMMNLYYNQFIAQTIDIKKEFEPAINAKVKTIQARSTDVNSSGVNNPILQRFKVLFNKETKIEDINSLANEFGLLGDKTYKTEFDIDFKEKHNSVFSNDQKFKLKEEIRNRFGISLSKETIDYFTNPTGSKHKKGASYLTQIYNNIPVLFKALEELITANDNKVGTTKNARKLANKESEFTNQDPNGLTSKDGTKFFAVGQYTATKKLKTNIAVKGQEYLNSLTIDRMYYNNPLIDPNHVFKAKIQNFESNNIVINGELKSKAYQEMNSLEWEQSCLEMYQNNTTVENGSHYGTLPFITPSDASNIEVRTIVKSDNLVKYNGTGFELRGIIHYLFEGHILPELKRIKKVREINKYIAYLNNKLKESKDTNEKRELLKEIKSLTVKEWNKQGENFVMFPELNPLIDDLLNNYGQYLEGENEILDNQHKLAGEIIAKISPLISEKALKSLNNDYAYLQELKLIDSDGNLNKNLVSDNTRHYLKNKTDIYNYLANRWISNLECTVIQSGDIAFYKSFDDTNKRAKQTQVPVRSAVPGKYKVVFTESVNKQSQFYEAYKNIIGEELADGYKLKVEKNKGIDTTDAATFCTMERLIQISHAIGENGRKLMEAVKRITENSELDYSQDLDFVMQTLKTFYFAHMPTTMNYKVQDAQGNFTIDKSSVTVIPTQIKHAVVPLIPAFIKNHPQLQLLNNKMVKQGIGEWVFDSATKVGNINNVTKEEASEWLLDETDTIELPTVELDMDNWGEVLDVPYKNTTAEKLSSQEMRKAVENVDDKNLYNVNWSDKPITGKELIDHYNKSINDVLKNQFDKFNANIYKDGSDELDVDKFKVYLKRLIEANDPNSYTEYWDKLLSDLNENNLHILDTPFNKNKVYSLLASSFNKDVLDIEINGKSAVLASTYGLQGDGIDITDLASNLDGTLHAAQLYNEFSKIEDVRANLKHIQREFNRLGMKVPQNENEALEALKTTAIVTADEIIVTPAYFIKSLKKKGIDPTIFMDKEGNMKVDLIPEELRFCAFHRIPYQDKNSNSKAYIKSFTNVSAGTVIYFSPDILVRSGASFNIDKVYIEHYDFLIKDNSWVLDLNNPKNKIIDTHIAVLSSPHHYKELITPNNAEGIREIRKTLGKEPKKDDTPWYSVKKQSVYRAANKACKDLIGIYSVMNVFHGIAQQIKPKFKAGYGVFILGHELTEFGNTKDLEGNLISDNNQQYGTAAVDGVKDPILGDLNHSVFTAPLKQLLNLIGFGKLNLERYTNTEMYRKVGIYYDELSLTETSSKATRLAFEKVAEEYGINDFAWSYINDFYATKVEKEITKNGKTKKIKVTQKSEITFNSYIKSKSIEATKKNPRELLYSLMYHHQLASKTSDFIQGSRLSNSGIKNNIAENTLNLEKNKTQFLKSDFIEFNSNAMESHWLGTYNNLMQGDFKNLTNEVNTYHSPFYELTFQKAKEYGVMLNNRTQVESFYRALDMFVILNDKYELRETYRGTTIKKGEFLTKFPKLFYNMFCVNKTEKNYFLDNLEVSKDFKGNDDLRFKWNDDLHFDEVSQSATEFYNKHPEAAKRLFGYSLKKYGFSNSKINPLKYMETVYNSLGVEEKYQKDYTVIKNAEEISEFPIWFDMDSFLIQYAMNNPGNIKKVYPDDDNKPQFNEGLNNYKNSIYLVNNGEVVVQQDALPPSQGTNNYVTNLPVDQIKLEKEEGCYWG